MIMDDVAYRQALEGDLSYVFSSWLKSYRRCRPADVSVKDYYSGHHDVLVRVLQAATITIACPRNNPNQIVGFCAVDGQLVHYVYVRNTFRRKYLPEANVAYRLLSSCVDVEIPLVASHKTKAGSKFLANNNLTASHNPYAAYLAGKEYFQWTSRSSP